MKTICKAILALSLVTSVSVHADHTAVDAGLRASTSIGSYSFENNVATSVSTVSASGAAMGNGLNGYAGAFVTSDLGGSATAVLYAGNGAAASADSGRTLQMGLQTVNAAGLTLEREVYVPVGEEFVRYLNVFTNSSAFPATITLEIVGNLTDPSTVILTGTGLTQGDAVADVNDNWVLTTYDGSTFIGHVFNGPGASALGAINFASGQADWNYDLVIPAGETAIVMHIVSDDNSAATLEAYSAALSVADVSTGILANLSQGQLNVLAAQYPDVPVVDSRNGGGGGSCFIATAAYGTPMAQEIDTLRAVRDTYMLNNVLGTTFVDTYYRLSPAVADKVAEHPMLAATVRVILTPFVLLGKLILAAPMVLLSALIAGAGLLLARRNTQGQQS